MPSSVSTPADAAEQCTLHPVHQRVLRDRAVPLAVAARMGWRSIQDIRREKDWAKHHKLDWEFKGCQAPRAGGLLIRYHRYDDGSQPYRIRVDHTSYTEPGPVVGSNHGEETIDCPRYLIPLGARVGPYFGAGVLAVRHDTAEPIGIAEAPLKAEALSAIGIPTIGMGGVCAGIHDSQALEDTGEILEHPELRRIRWDGRQVYVFFDAGLATNPMVALGAARVWRVLSGLDARVMIVPIPFHRPEENDLENGLFHFETDQGPDDLLARRGIEGIMISPYAADPLVRVRDIVGSLPSVEDRTVALAALSKENYFRAALKEMTRAERGVLVRACKGALSSKAVEEVVERFGQDLKKKNGDASKQVYSIKDRRLHMGDVELTNFTARIESQTMRDDGESRSRFYSVSGSLTDGTTLPPADVAAGEFSEMAWVHRDWGARAIVSAGRGSTAHTAVAIQTLSTPTDRTVFTHTGWREINGQQVFLVPGGGIGADGRVEVDVELPGLRGYRCPTLVGTVEDVRSAVLASLAFAELAPQTTTPLAGCVYVAPLATALGGLDFVTWVVGRSGSQKSTLAALALSHFGAFQGHSSLPASWTDTVNALETKAFLTKDTALGVDNYTPAVNERQKAEQASKAERLIQSTGDNAGRGRCNRDGSLQARVRHPRGVIISTAETLPPSNESTFGRCVVIQRPQPTTTAKGTTFSSDIDVRRLTRAQELAEDYPTAMGAYLQWLARRGFDGVRDRHLELRAGMSGRHSRTPSAMAALLVGWEMFLEFAVSVGAIDAEERGRYLDTVRKILDALAAAQPEVAHQRAVDLFVATLGSMLGCDEVGLALSPSLSLAPRTGAPGSKPVPLVGWEHDDQVWLDPEATYAAVARHLGPRWLASETELSRQLRDGTVEVDGESVRILAATDPGRADTKRTVDGGRRPRVWVFDRRVLDLGTSALVSDRDEDEVFGGGPH